MIYDALCIPSSTNDPHSRTYARYELIALLLLTRRRTIPAPARDRRPRVVVTDARYERIMYGLETLAMKASLCCSEHVGLEIRTLHSCRKSTSYTILVHCDKGKPDDTNSTI